MENKDMEQPCVVSSHDIHIDTEYADWIAEVKHRYRSAQVKAAVRVNAEKLLFNWQLGRDLVQKKAEDRWGAGVVEQISLDLKKEFPEDEGFSTSNLWYMKKWYLFYTKEMDVKILQRAVGEVQNTINQFPKKLYQVGKELSDENSSKLVEKNSNDPLEKFPRMNLCNDPLQNFHKCLDLFHGDNI